MRTCLGADALRGGEGMKYEYEIHYRTKGISDSEWFMYGTAQYGINMKKTIFAVPGTPGESRSQGANTLIKNGAILVENTSDILPFLKGNKKVEQPELEQYVQKNLVFENFD